MEHIVFVVMEHASAWPSGVGGDSAGCVVLRQQPQEPHLALLRRALLLGLDDEDAALPDNRAGA